MRGTIAIAFGVSSLCWLAAVASTEETRLERHDLEDLLAAGVSSSTIEEIVRETGRRVALSEADVAALKARGLGEEAVALLRQRMTELAAPIAAEGAGRGKAASVATGNVPQVAFDSSGLGPCLCGDDPVCVYYCLAISSGNRGSSLRRSSSEVASTSIITIR